MEPVPGTLEEALAPPQDVGAILALVPELGLARGLAQGPFHHLDVFGHILETVRGVEEELAEDRIGARVSEERREALRVAGLLHDIAKPVTRGQVEERVLFVAHDSLGAGLSYRICRRLGLSAGVTDLAATVTALHLKIGFMSNSHSDYPPDRLVRAVGPFAGELAVLSWADRLAARGERLKPEHVERHRELCLEFLTRSREGGPYPVPNYAGLAGKLGLPAPDGAEAGYAASRIRLLESRGLGTAEALDHVSGLP
ncbi:MAG: HD domain-containing protein [Rubrobacter sp.]|nr:HD domain-containing protein [Rubrobacter sp.]